MNIDTYRDHELQKYILNVDLKTFSITSVLKLMEECFNDDPHKQHEKVNICEYIIDNPSYSMKCHQYISGLSICSNLIDINTLIKVVIIIKKYKLLYFKLKITEKALFPKHIEIIIDNLIYSNSNLQDLDLSNNKITYAGYNNLLKSIVESKKILRELNLSGVGVIIHFRGRNNNIPHGGSIYSYPSVYFRSDEIMNNYRNLLTKSIVQEINMPSVPSLKLFMINHKATIKAISHINSFLISLRINPCSIIEYENQLLNINNSVSMTKHIMDSEVNEKYDQDSKYIYFKDCSPKYIEDTYKLYVIDNDNKTQLPILDITIDYSIHNEIMIIDISTENGLILNIWICGCMIFYKFLYYNYNTSIGINKPIKHIRISQNKIIIDGTNF